MVLGLVTCVPAPSPSSPVFRSEFDRILKSRWEEAAGLCRYRLDRVETKIILPGKYGFVAQFNPEKSKPGWRRPCQNLRKVNAVFDPQQFNFNRIDSREVLMSPVELGEIDTFLVINTSPLEFGSCLLVPRMTQNINQRITLQGLELLIKTVLLSTDPHLKAGFSSPGACASVNHQHYHLYYLQEQLYLEQAPAERIAAGPCYAVNSFPSKGFAFQLEDDPIQLARHVFTLADYMRQNEMAHNMFITRGRRFETSQRSSSAGDDAVHYDTLRVFLWAREPAFGVKKDYGLNPALCEMAGHLLTTDASEYESMTEDSVCKMLESMTSIWYQKILPKIPQLFRQDFQDSI